MEKKQNPKLGKAVHCDPEYISINYYKWSTGEKATGNSIKKGQINSHNGNEHEKEEAKQFHYGTRFSSII